MEIFAWLHLAQLATRSRFCVARPALLGWGAASAALAVTAAFPGPGYFALRAEGLPGVRDYFSEPYTRQGYFVPGSDFLADAGLEGNLFNRYTVGGYLGHRLSPRIRTFVDGRAEHYGAEVLFDYFAINRQRVNARGESALEALDRYGVDLYFGVGYPMLGERVYTTARLEGEPGWLQIFRSHDHSIWLRRNDRNRANLARVARYYAERGVPFSPAGGFDAAQALRRAPGWAVAAGVVPEGYPEMRRRSESDDRRERHAARGWLATLYYLLGCYDEQVALDREIIAEQPRDLLARWRLAYGLLRSGRTSEALTQAGTTTALDTSPRSQAVLAIARAVHEGRAPADGRPLGSILDDASLYLQPELRAFYAAGREAHAREAQ